MFTLSLQAQDKTTVRANSTDISDNLDLRAIASVFGDSENLEDFEYRINDPKAQLSNLDLNNDNYVDYLRVIESVENDAHLIIIQSVLEKDTYQDVATIEVERGSNNKVQIQVVGNVYMYGENYIYEPIYVHTPVIYSTFWVRNYRPYCSSWYWNYYPTHYVVWNPFPIFRYRNHINIHINFGHTYHYVNTRSCHRAYAMYHNHRSYAYETRHPHRSFSHRNNGYSNRHHMVNNRPTRTIRPRNDVASNETRGNTRTRSSSTRNTRDISTNSNSPRRNNTRENSSTRNTRDINTNSPRRTRNTESTRTRQSNEYNTPRRDAQTRNTTTRRTSSTRETANRSNSPTRETRGQRSENSRNNGRNN